MVLSPPPPINVEIIYADRNVSDMTNANFTYILQHWVEGEGEARGPGSLWWFHRFVHCISLSLSFLPHMLLLCLFTTMIPPLRLYIQNQLQSKILYIRCFISFRHDCLKIRKKIAQGLSPNMFTLKTILKRLLVWKDTLS